MGKGLDNVLRIGLVNSGDEVATKARAHTACD
jgi:hypothetical protein